MPLRVILLISPFSQSGRIPANSARAKKGDIGIGRQERRDVVLMNEEDMTRLNLNKNDRVNVSSQAGVMNQLLVRPHEIKKGAALMYYPEVNVLIGQHVDPKSRTPGFKSTIVTIQVGS